MRRKERPDRIHRCTKRALRAQADGEDGGVGTSTLLHMETLNMERAAPILIRIYKEEGTVEVWKQDQTGRFSLLSAYPICKYSGHLGPKIFEGDHQAPEGFYDITPDQMKSDR